MKKIAYLILFCVFAFSVNALAAMSDYCATPPFLPTPVKPNILIVQDFSGSMQFPAYGSCNFTGYNSGDVAECGSSSSATYRYNATKTYYGLFDTTKYYTPGSSRFASNSACTYTDNIGSSTCISGNLLNWITATRIDVTRKVLTGGRTQTGQADTFESEGAVFEYTDTTLKCKFTVSANNTANRKIKIENDGGVCPITPGATSYDIKVKSDNPSSITGLVQNYFNADKATFEFMVFSTGTGSYSRYGEMKSAKDSTLSSLVSAINNETPYNGTPTGEALWEAYDFFKQSNDHGYESNTAAISSGSGIKDPWYDGSGTGDPVPCRKSFVLLLSDGEWNGSVDPMVPARTMLINDLRNATAMTGKQNVRTYTVFAFGGGNVQGRQAMITTAMFGGFDDYDANNYPYPYTSMPSSSLTVTYPLSLCDPNGTWNSHCSEWDKGNKRLGLSKTGLPYNFFEADDGSDLEQALTDAIEDMLSRASSGTAASMLASSEGSGANLLQAVFYPKRSFDIEVKWIGELQNLWYYIDPFLGNSSIREDTDQNKALNLTNDYYLNFYFDSTDSKTKVERYSDNGTSLTLVDKIDLEDLTNLWAAGKLLHARSLATSPRTIYTYNLTGTSTSNNLMTFNTSNESSLRSYLQAATAAEGNEIINYTSGIDQPGYRSRTVTIGVNTNPWRLGDIISSTPRIQSSVRLNTYHLQMPKGYSDTTYSTYIFSDDYRGRGMVYVGANDGMLHAFTLGTMDFKPTAPNKAKLCEDANSNFKCDTGETGVSSLGQEKWAYIPKNSLPYLKYLGDPNYCHIYFVDSPVYLFDASINKHSDCAASNYYDCDKQTILSGSNALNTARTSWRSLLFGGMGQGGACRYSTGSCNNIPSVGNTNCVKGPVAANGLSSYFVLDVTNQNSPSLLWEFSDPELGYSTSGPSIVRIGDKDKNGKWFAIFASGPTGPITNSNFMGTSDQNLKIFIVDLKTGTLERTIDTGIAHAFAGSIVGTTFDSERTTGGAGKYNDDVFYLTYVKKSGSTWTDGGVLRIITKEDANPNNWTVSTLIDGIGPITTAVSKLQDTRGNNLWLYFGTGRYFYKGDDQTSQRRVFGVKDKCYASGNAIDKNCSVSAYSLSSLHNSTTTPPTSAVANGWYITLDASTGTFDAERVITDPVAASSGVVFYTTFTPTSDICGFGGNTYIWAVRYDTGGSAAGLMGAGTANIQLSTGAITQVSLQSAFTDKAGRRTTSMIGTPPKGQGLTILTQPKAIKKWIHLKEK